MNLTSIQKKSLSEGIVIQIIQYIRNENLKAGDKLPSEDRLVEKFHVSKTAVREALSILASKGILEKRPGVGSILKEVTGSMLVEDLTTQLIINKQSLREILEFRRVIEVEAAGLAAERATEEQMIKIKEAHLELIYQNQNGEIGIQEDYRFHYLIVVSSNNSIFETIFNTISSRIFEAIKITKKQSVMLSQQYITETHEEHQRITDAILSKDPNSARLEMLNHLHKNEEKLWNNELSL
ncbi:FadR/GntR family transcriptional regulator [Neobacillus mesonae]|uniref:FadR/GntR family transcriptional regulator n=1 Tax=Neobacillus mesonae TaxID=1193713 RepID=UPI002E217AFB|nr:FadR/GntR family transcriptional regulator [Neobacillus mesonae]